MFDPGNAAVRVPLRFFRPAILGVVLLLPLVGCVSGGSGNPFDDSANLDWYNLRVQSRNLYDVSVYAVLKGRRHLIGVASPNRLEYFEFEYPSGLPLMVELESEIGDRYRIPSVPFIGGGRVNLLVSNELRRSGFVRIRQE